MSLSAQEIAELRDQLGISDVTNLVKDIATERETERKQAEEKALRDAEDARVKSLVDSATGEMKTKLEAATKLIGDLSERLEKNGVDAFAKRVQELEDDLKAKSAEISQILAAREGKNRVASAVKGTFDFEQEADNAVLLAFVAKKGIMETDYAQRVTKAVNDSSSIEVSSENYETVFSARLLRDIQSRLVVGAMFQELPMTSKKLTMQIEPDSGEASWVDATTYGTRATVGNEITAALTEITFSTFKLAAKAYMTDETEEDAIVALLPIIRRHLIESHVKAIEKAFMGDGTVSAVRTGKPTGLLDFANIDSKVVATTATADGTTKVAASMIHKLRRQLGLKGLNLAELALVVSMDAYYDLLEDDAWQDLDKVGNAAIKLQGQVGRIYGLPVVVSSFFPAKAVSVPFCLIVYRGDYVVPRQRAVTVEYERRASEQRDAYYVTQRCNLQRFFANNVVTGTYAAA